MNTSQILRTRLLKACNEYIAYRDKYMESEREKLIKLEFKRIDKGVFFGLIKTTKTREQIINDLEKYSYSWEFIKYTWEKENKNILAVKSLCMFSNSELITVDSNTVYSLSDFLKDS